MPQAVFQIWRSVSPTSPPLSSSLAWQRANSCAESLLSGLIIRRLPPQCRKDGCHRFEPRF
eukprot:5608273-Pyramimonas_sp.AAC.1